MDLVSQGFRFIVALMIHDPPFKGYQPKRKIIPIGHSDSYVNQKSGPIAILSP